MSKGSCIAAFIFGAAIGSVVTWKLVRTKYEQIAQAEIDAFYEQLDREVEETATKEFQEEIEEPEVQTEVKEYTEEIEKNNYISYSKRDIEEKEVSDVKKPYVIPPEEFGERDNYDTETLFYYEDKVLADDSDNEIVDVEKLVGRDSLTHFGEYEDDSVFVRNESLKTDYEILRSERLYSEVLKPYPHLDEDE